MLRRRAVVLLLLLLASACLWRSYEEILAVHLDVLTVTADKLDGVVSSGHSLTTQGMTEYVYPAQRARQFLGQFSKHKARPSYVAMQELLTHYENMVAAVDAARPLGTIDTGKLHDDVRTLRALAGRIRNDAAAGR